MKGTIVAIMLFFGLNGCQEVSSPPPNILWITVEDISTNLGCYGDSLAYTPTLDALASKGFLYNNAIANAPVCAPARNAIITGMYPSSLGTLHMRSFSSAMKSTGRIPEDVKLYPEVLRKAGYYCTNNSKEDYNFNLKRKIWDESSKTAHWKNRPNKDTPFFSIFNLIMTHESCINDKGKHERLTQDLPEHLRTDPSKIEVPPYFPDTSETRTLLTRHYDNIATMDAVVEKILDELKAAGESENTIVFFYSDHGTGLPRHKRWLFDTGVKVPFIVYIPEQFKELYPAQPGSEVNQLVSFIDLAPTVIELAGAEIPKTMQGQSFLGEKQKPERDYVYLARGRMDERYDIQRGVRSKQYKYLRYYEPKKPFIQYMNTPEGGPMMTELRKAEKAGTLKPEGQQLVATTKPTESLFDLQKDPMEFNDLAHDPNMKEVLTQLRSEHDQWMKKVLDVGLIPEAIMRRWEEKNNRSIYEWIRTQEDFYDYLLLMSSTADENILFEGLNHPNEAVRYCAGQGLYNLDKKIKNSTIERLIQKLDDSIVNVSISAARVLLKHESPSNKIFKILSQGLEAENEWTRLQTALVLDDFQDALRALESTAQNHINSDPNKYVVRVLNHGLNVLNGTMNKVK
ncbi:MAG: sulfatase [Flavobacteriaceae bacterium]|nr:sulfatase [Flavobacteriaceae bacterium]MDG1942487.1 sulfatase [Flavobacteriaceae bacterium]